MKWLKRFLNSRNKFWLKVGVVLSALILIALLTKATHILAGTDDAVLSAGMHHYSVFTWVPRQYQIWSGRVTAESLIVIIYNLPIWVWKVLQVVVFCGLILTLYLYYTLVPAQKRTPHKDIAMLVVCSLSPLLISVGVLRWGAFWITGSLNYLWIAVLGLATFYPLLYTYVHKKLPNKAWMIFGIVGSLFAAMGQEQVYLLMCLFSVGIVALLTLKTKKLWIYPIVQTGVTLIASIVSYTAPGNKRRLAAEMQTYIPTFHSAPLLDRLNWSYRWVIDSLINHFGYILPILWILIIALLFVGIEKQSNKAQLFRRIMIILLLAATLAVCKIVPDTNITNFYVAWGVFGLPKASYLYLLFWSAVVAATIAGLYELSKRYSYSRFSLPLVFLGVIAGTSALVLSPTMYASGTRVILIPSILALVLIVVLMSYAIKEYWKYRTLLVGAVVICALITFIGLNEAISIDAMHRGF